jgi:hypothetical protein
MIDVMFVEEDALYFTTAKENLRSFEEAAPLPAGSLLVA